MPTLSRMLSRGCSVKQTPAEYATKTQKVKITQPPDELYIIYSELNTQGHFYGVAADQLSPAPRSGEPLYTSQVLEIKKIHFQTTVNTTTGRRGPRQSNSPRRFYPPENWSS